jgi:hypothetical protein
MGSVLRWGLWAAAAALLAMGGGAVLSARGAGLAREATWLLAEWDRAAALEGRAARRRSRLGEKERVTAELIAGRRSLAEAAEALCDAEVASQGDFHWVRAIYPGLSQEEAAYRHAVRWALVMGRGRRAPAGPLLARLRREFEAHFHHPLPPQP